METHIETYVRLTRNVLLHIWSINGYCNIKTNEPCYKNIDNRKKYLIKL